MVPRSIGPTTTIRRYEALTQASEYETVGAIPIEFSTDVWFIVSLNVRSMLFVSNWNTTEETVGPLPPTAVTVTTTLASVPWPALSVPCTENVWDPATTLRKVVEFPWTTRYGWASCRTATAAIPEPESLAVQSTLIVELCRISPLRGLRVGAAGPFVFTQAV